MLEEKDKDEEIIEFLENYEYSESLSIFFSLRKDCLGVIDPPIVLEHQIQKSDGSRISIQDLEMLVKDGELRKLKVPRSIPSKNMTSCIGYSLKSDIFRVLNIRIREKYLNLENQVNGCFLDCLFNGEKRVSLLQEISRLIKVVFQDFKTISANNKQLSDHLSLISNSWKSEYRICENHNKILDGDFLLDILIRFGILRRDASDLHNLIFTTPSMGLFIQFLESGNSIIVNSLRRSKYKELFEDKFYSLKLGKSLLPIDFHLKDLHGTGIIKRM
ncbi:uncharacterized protein cubi_02479 [Cryptosporidium ubiquitum]|uniref:Uncharacterized protein n=1 Tax=Cryptosporidium ubiquitum TaxID=857276 RepID=A0A1J4MGW8_9CRYT|nr:uncharacterized protein cubi_02479 [Cryptosporidium ubiquitum]OII73247.1 hypothetical protein cubi_02479 [Cryptosporidium ubiquitum]